MKPQEADRLTRIALKNVIGSLTAVEALCVERNDRDGRKAWNYALGALTSLAIEFPVMAEDVDALRVDTAKWVADQ
jgi:hypothetical protein